MKYILGLSCLFLSIYFYIFCQYGNCYQFIKDNEMIYRVNPRTGKVERCPLKTPDCETAYWESISNN